MPTRRGYVKAMQKKRKAEAEAKESNKRLTHLTDIGAPGIGTKSVNPVIRAAFGPKTPEAPKKKTVRRGRMRF